MSFVFLGVVFISVLVGGYYTYGLFLRRTLGLDDRAKTPAHRFNDGVDYVPTKKFYLFAQHFSAIAAAGPIAGPIIACLAWGWLPALLWIALGVVVIGAVHDFLSLTISLRHEGHSIADITKTELGKGAGLAMVVFIWLALIYVIVAFTDITAASFVGVTEEFAGTTVAFNQGGAVAAAAVMYLVLSMIMGLIQRYLNPPLWLVTIIFVPLTFAAVYFATKISTILIFDAVSWGIAILLYCGVASVLPVWLLLQPRGYLGGFFLYIVLAIGVMGMFFGDYEIKQEAFKTFDTGKAFGHMWPFLFVTIACGACSGFHGLVCSGTTSKQIDRESHAHAVGYGAMLCEAFVALIALVTIMIFSQDEISGLKPGAIYGKGIGEFLTLLIGKEHLMFAITFGAMAFSTFVFDTLDVSTRLGRYLLTELVARRGALATFLATAVTTGVPMIFIATAKEGSYLQFWTIFGASNQLLAALTLLTITTWLYRARKRIWYTLCPMLFVLAVTFWALIELSVTNFKNAASGQEGAHIALVNGSIALALIGLAIFLVGSGLQKIMRRVET